MTAIPKLAGLAEVTGLASEHYGRAISRKRAWQLTQHRAFPPPVQSLAMGPVWLEGDVREFLAMPRPSGRQPVPAGSMKGRAVIHQDGGPRDNDLPNLRITEEGREDEPDVRTTG
jgi:hypothetical protein